MSNIFGTIRTTGFGTANLFLMNPAGYLFGPNATVNVGGMVGFTSADYLRLTDNAQFNAIPNPIADALFTASPSQPSDFWSRIPDHHGSRRPIQGNEATGISMVGGNITIESGTTDNGAVQSARLLLRRSDQFLRASLSSGEVMAAILWSKLPILTDSPFGNSEQFRLNNQ